jgi:hypothetical protein
MTDRLLLTDHVGSVYLQRRHVNGRAPRQRPRPGTERTSFDAAGS